MTAMSAAPEILVLGMKLEKRTVGSQARQIRHGTTAMGALLTVRFGSTHPVNPTLSGE
ncbi:MAG: hypothetical protein P8X77_12730 [Maritimibacter sp.]